MSVWKLNLVLLCLSMLSGCSKHAGENREAASNEPRSVPAADDRLVELNGTVSKHAEAHTKRSMLTGNYHLQTERERLELLPTEAVDESAFEAAIGKRVAVTGRLVTGRTLKTSGPNPEGVQRPAEEMGDEIPLDDGILVESLQVLAE